MSELWNVCQSWLRLLLPVPNSCMETTTTRRGKSSVLNLLQFSQFNWTTHSLWKEGGKARCEIYYVLVYALILAKCVSFHWSKYVRKVDEFRGNMIAKFVLSPVLQNLLFAHFKCIIGLHVFWKVDEFTSYMIAKCVLSVLWNLVYDF